MVYKFIMIIISLLVIVPVTLGEVALEDFFPYGEEAHDKKLKKEDDDFGEVDLKVGGFHFFNTTYDKVFVMINGGISFGQGVKTFTPNCGPSDIPMIIPYWADIDSTLGGTVWYRESTDPTLLEKATTEVQNSFPHLTDLALNWMFICTWDDSPFYGATDKCGGLDKRNNFQAILVTDGTSSFAIFYYNRIEWTTGTASKGDCNGLGGTPAKSGFDLGDGNTFFQLPGSCTADIMDVTTTSNVDQPGKWIFKVDKSFEAEPESNPEEQDVFVEPPSVEETTTLEPEEIQDTTTPEPDVVVEPTTPEPVTLTIKPTEPDGCDPYNCDNLGYCRHYSICSTASRTWEQEKCPPLLFWNPRHRSGVNPHMECIGGCDYWRNLDETTKVAYYKDHKCQTHFHQLHTARTSGYFYRLF